MNGDIKVTKKGRFTVVARRHPIKTDSYVWCDHHGEIHAAEVDFYQEGSRDECSPANWRSVYVLGDKGEQF